MPTSRRSEFLGGVRGQLPLLLGVTPFGLAYGAYAVESGLSPALAQSMSWIVFGGASQFAGTQLMAEGVPGVVIVLTAALVNLRHMLYSASIGPRVEHLSRGWRALLAYLLTDEAYAVAMQRYRAEDLSETAGTAGSPRAITKTALDRTPVAATEAATAAGAMAQARAPFAHWYFFGTALALWLCWQVSTALGVFVGTAVPDSWQLDFALPLTFLAIVVPLLDNRATVAAAVVAGVVGVAGDGWSYGTGLLTAALAGIVAGLLVERALAERDDSLTGPS